MDTSYLLDKALFLRKIALFDTLEVRALLEIADKLSSTELDQGEVLFTSGGEAERLYMIVRGKILLKNQEQTLSKLSSQEIFGEEALFQSNLRTYSAEALENTLLFTLSKGHFFAILSEYPSVSIALIQMYLNGKSFLSKKPI